MTPVTVTLTLRAPYGRVDATALSIAVQRYLTERLGLSEADACVLSIRTEQRFEPEPAVIR